MEKKNLFWQKNEKYKKETIEGYGKIKFEKLISYGKIRNPQEDFKLIEQKIEYRKDPLTKHYSRINRLRAERVKQANLPGENVEDNIKKLIDNSMEKCFFCPVNVSKSTPKLPEELGLGERFTNGDFLLFPNLYVFSENHAIGVLGKEHFTHLKDFKTKIWKEAIKGSIEYFKAVYKNNNKNIYPSINFNYLPPSASSIIHPHIQIIQDCQPTKYTQILLDESYNYSKKNKKSAKSFGNYWLDLIESEKKLNERFIFENDFITWLASFSPMGKDELLGIVKIAKTDITTFTENEIEEIAKSIVTAFNALYQGRGSMSINMATYLGPIGYNLSKYFRITIKIVSRPILTPNYTGDIGFMELLHNEPIAAATPEVIAETVKKYFQ